MVKRIGLQRQSKNYLDWQERERKVPSPSKVHPVNFWLSQALQSLFVVDKVVNEATLITFHSLNTSAFKGSDGLLRQRQCMPYFFDELYSEKKPLGCCT